MNKDIINWARSHQLEVSQVHESSISTSMDEKPKPVSIPQREVIEEEEYIEEEESKKVAKTPIIKVNKKDVLEYKSVADFVYKKMTVGGLVSKSTSLSEVDLKVLKKLVQKELDAFKPKKRKK